MAQGPLIPRIVTFAAAFTLVIGLARDLGNVRFARLCYGSAMTGMVKDFGCRPARLQPCARGRRPKSAQGRPAGHELGLWVFMDFDEGADVVGCL
jgi:hypothetical protein